MNAKRIIGLVLAVWALVAFVVPVSSLAADEANDLLVYFRPAVRFGTDDRTLFILDFLVPVYRGNKDLLFINTKFTPDNREAWETNLGVGYRRLVAGDRLVLGGNLFYDHRKTRYGSHFDQIGLGFEAMAEPGGVGLAARFNYYQPLTKAKLGEDFGYAFYGNGIYTAGIEEPMTGFDYEAGVRIPGISNYVETWAYAGGYHFFGCHVPDVNGVSARIEAMPTDFLRLNFEFRNDSVNHDQYYGEVAFEVPFSIENLVAGKNPFEGVGDVLNGSRSLKERMVEPVRRDVDIVVGTGYLSGPDAASGDGDFREGVIFVADNAPAGGDGSFEHPYNVLALADGDARLGDTVGIVHVLAGDGTGLAGEDFAQDGITIWGAGAANPVYPYVTNFLQGYPIINSTLGMNAPDMTVLGLNFELSDVSAIEIGNGAAGAGLSIFANRIDIDGDYGICGSLAGDLGAPGAPVYIADNTILVDSSDEAAGILLVTDGSIYASIRNNRLGVITDSLNNAYGICVVTDGGDFTGLVSGNTISDVFNGDSDAYGIYTEAGSGNFTGSISGNMISGVNSENSDAHGISTYIGGTFTGAISRNTISDISGYSDTYGIYSYINLGDFTGSISGNTVSGVSASGTDYTYAYGIYGRAGGDFPGAISGNTISGVSASGTTYGYAYGIYGRAVGDFLGSISGNTTSGISANTMAFGIYGQAVGDFLGDISGNTIGVSASGAGSVSAYGIYGYAYGDFLGDISGNTIGVSGTTGAAYVYGIRAVGVADLLGCSITNNYIEVSSGSNGCGLRAESSGSLGTASSPLVFTGNSGTIDAPTAYAAYLLTNDPDLSNVYIGSGNNGMGANSFTTTGAWFGNYPEAGGPIRATDNGSFINP